jgi:hypothetical protein
LLELLDRNHLISGRFIPQKWVYQHNDGRHHAYKKQRFLNNLFPCNAKLGAGHQQINRDGQEKEKAKQFGCSCQSAHGCRKEKVFPQLLPVFLQEQEGQRND